MAGIQNPAGCRPSRPVPVVAFHGTADPFVSYTGGLGPSALKLAAPDGSRRTLGQVLGKAAQNCKGPSIPVIAAAWAKRNGCAPKPSDRKVATGVTLIAFSCPKGDEVELYRVTGGGHAWPGSPVSKEIASVVGYTTMAISADQIMWSFFAAHSAAALSITAAAPSCHPRARAVRSGPSVPAAACAGPPGPRPRGRG